MKFFSVRSPFPLLAKELIEQAARKRTYIIRVAYAVVLFAVFGFYLNSRTYSYGGGFSPNMLGMGMQLFEFLVEIQLFGIYLLLPGTMCSVLTYEKERDSLALLLLTDLRPWEILLQKYLGGLILMFTFLLLSLPLLALCYALGGITTNYLANGIVILFLACLQVGAIAIACSAYFRSTTTAFIIAYIVTGVSYFVIPLSGIFNQVKSRPFGYMLACSIPILIVTGVFLALARVFLVRRAFARARNVTLQMFKSLDRFWNRCNRLTGGIVLIKDKSGLPEDGPVAWRETTKRSLGKINYLFRICVVLELPALFIGLNAVLEGRWGGPRDVGLTVMVYFLWAIAVLGVSIKSANAVLSERTRQTLDVLLATPMSGRDIMKQKMGVLWRIMVVLLVPFLTLFLLEGAAKSGRFRSGPGDLGQWGYFATSVALVLVYLPMFSWVSCWIGMKSRRRTRAVITVLAVIVIWNLLPFVVAIVLQEVFGVHQADAPGSFLAVSSPFVTIMCTELNLFREAFRGMPWAVPVMVSLLWHGAILFCFRSLCLAKADAYLGRVRPVSERKQRMTDAAARKVIERFIRKEKGAATP